VTPAPAPSPLSEFATDGEEPPRAGFRARLWRRFEQGYHEWLETPEGRFARFCAERDLDADPAAAELS
jgi:hypothetical protein